MNTEARGTAGRYASILLLLLVLTAASGCVTEKVLQVRREREAKVASVTRFRSIAGVQSGWTSPDGTVFACTQFQDGPGATPKALTIRVSDSPVFGRTFDSFTSGGSGTSASDRELPLYMYPLKRALPGCAPPADSTPLPVKIIRLSPNEQGRIPEIIRSPEFGSAREDGLFLVDFQPPGSASPSIRDVLLVFRPASDTTEPKAYGIPGGWEPGSEWLNPYTLLVAPAAVADAVIVAAAIIGLAAPYAPR